MILFLKNQTPVQIIYIQSRHLHLTQNVRFSLKEIKTLREISNRDEKNRNNTKFWSVHIFFSKIQIFEDICMPQFHF